MSRRRACASQFLWTFCRRRKYREVLFSRILAVIRYRFNLLCQPILSVWQGLPDAIGLNSLLSLLSSHYATSILKPRRSKQSKLATTCASSTATSNTARLISASLSPKTTKRHSQHRCLNAKRVIFLRIHATTTRISKRRPPRIDTASKK